MDYALISSLKKWKTHKNKKNFHPLIKRMLYSSKKYSRTFAINSLENGVGLSEDDKFNCCYCNVEIYEKNHSIDHFIPRSKGGERHNINNLKLSCKSCNSLKANIHPYKAPHLLNFAFQHKHYKLPLSFIIKHDSKTLIEYWNLFNIKVKFLIFIKIYILSYFLRKKKYQDFIMENSYHNFDGILKKPLKEDRFIIWKKAIFFNLI